LGGLYLAAGGVAQPVKVLDLFSGIGGFSLGLERAGFETVAFCEQDQYCRAVLRQHWPDVPAWTDIKCLCATDLAAGGIFPDVICGGFPCQDISLAGKGAGLAGERSGLWREYARLIGEIRPRYVIVENVSALLSRGLGAVLGDLAEIGYDAEWHCIPAAYVGAPHRRDRVWIIAYPGGDVVRLESGRRSGASGAGAAQPGVDGAERSVADADRRRLESIGVEEYSFLERASRGLVDGRSETGRRDGADVPDPVGERLEGLDEGRSAARATDGSGDGRHSGWWAVEPDVGRVAHGVPSRVDRLRSLGNSLVPAIAEMIGRAIMECERV
jgi:DNA (cytosine-5)-methyltransferase 1